MIYVIVLCLCRIAMTNAQLAEAGIRLNGATARGQVVVVLLVATIAMLCEQFDPWKTSWIRRGAYASSIAFLLGLSMRLRYVGLGAFGRLLTVSIIDLFSWLLFSMAAGYLASKLCDYVGSALVERRQGANRVG